MLNQLEIDIGHVQIIAVLLESDGVEDEDSGQSASDSVMEILVGQVDVPEFIIMGILEQIVLNEDRE